MFSNILVITPTSGMVCTFSLPMLMGWEQLSRVRNGFEDESMLRKQGYEGSFVLRARVEAWGGQHTCHYLLFMILV